MNFPLDGTTRDKGGPRKCWSCFQTSWTQLGWSRMESVCPHPLRSLYYSKAVWSWRNTADRKHVKSRIQLYNLCYENQTYKTELPKASEWINKRGKKGGGRGRRNHGFPCNSRIYTKNVNTLQGVSTLYMLPNYFRALMFQYREAKRQDSSAPVTGGQRLITLAMETHQPI